MSRLGAIGDTLLIELSRIVPDGSARIAAIQTIGLKRILGVPLWLGVILSLLDIPLAMPLGIMFMRSPF